MSIETIEESLQRIRELQSLVKKLEFQKEIDANLDKRFKIISKMFFTNDITVEENLSYQEAYEKIGKYPVGDSYEWYEIEQDKNF